VNAWLSRDPGSAVAGPRERQGAAPGLISGRVRLGPLSPSRASEGISGALVPTPRFGRTIMRSGIGNSMRWLRAATNAQRARYFRNNPGVAWASVKNLRLACSAITVAALAASGANSAPNVFPGRNGRIVFASDRAIPGQPQADYRNGEIYSLDLASGRSRDLSRSTDDERAPAFSPDGAWIAFARSSSAGGGLWLMRRDGRAQRRLAELDIRADIDRQVITWSPDGTRVAFSAVGPSASSGLWVVNTDGSGLRRLTGFYVETPRWSPGGTEIAFAGSVGVAPAHVGVIGADGTGLRWLTARRRTAARSPSTSATTTAAGRKTAT
jgi:Tol biopolymer transport system component